MIEASQRMINEQNNLIVNKHFELQIKTLLQNAPIRDADRLERLLKRKQREKEEAMYMEDTHKDWLQKLKCSRLYCIW